MFFLFFSANYVERELQSIASASSIWGRNQREGDGEDGVGGGGGMSPLAWRDGFMCVWLSQGVLLALALSMSTRRSGFSRGFVFCECVLCSFFCGVCFPEFVCGWKAFFSFYPLSVVDGHQSCFLSIFFLSGLVR